MRTRSPLLALLTLSLGLAAPSFAHADEIYTFVIKKQEDKANTRWSLSDWLETRDKMRLMDLWLAIHSPSPYEFYVGGHYVGGQQGGNYSGSQFHAGAYATIFGLEAQRESSLDTRWFGLFHLRVFGYHAQGTNITLEGGLRQENDDAATFRNALAGVSLNFYLARYFGLEGLYRHYFDSTPNSTGAVFGGNLYEGGAFIDFSFLRVYGKYFDEQESAELTNLGAGATARNGFEVGARIFF